MSKITSLSDRRQLDMLRDAITKALKEVGAELGVSMAGGNISYAPDGKSCSVKVEVKRIIGGVEHDPMAEDWNQYCKLFGFEPGDRGRVFVSRGSRYQIIGLKPSAHRYPVQTKRLPDGRFFGFPAEAVKLALGAAKTAA